MLLITSVLLILIVASGLAYLFLRQAFAPKEQVLADHWDMVFQTEEPVLGSTAKLYYGQVKIKMTSHERIDQEKGKAVVMVTTPDMQKIMDQVIALLQSTNGLTDEQRKDLARRKMDELLTQDTEIVSTTIDVETRMSDGEWKIVSSDAWIKAISGNVAEIYRTYRSEALAGDMG